jgi:hypothetical protein
MKSRLRKPLGMRIDDPTQAGEINPGDDESKQQKNRRRMLHGEITVR